MAFELTRLNPVPLTETLLLGFLRACGPLYCHLALFLTHYVVSYLGPSGHLLFHVPF